MVKTEIERKWLLRSLPFEEEESKYWIEQFYISTDPEVRLRRCMPNGNYENRIPYRLTIKGEGSLSRIEIQTAVDEDFYNQALDYVNLDPIQKHFISYKDKKTGHKVEVGVVLEDVNKGRTPFTYAEVEFDSEEEAFAYQFPWPEIVIKEVTNDPEWKMKNYWRRTRLTD